MPRPITISKTTRVSATSTAATVSGESYAGMVRIISKVFCHVSVTGSDATVDDFPIVANEPAFINVPSGADISIVKGTGESNGDVWVSLI